jgi:tetratricopeptide (TPR) repeat protein
VAEDRYRSTPGAPPDEEARRLGDETRARQRRERLARVNPLLGRVTRVQELVERGRQAAAQGRYTQAANDFRTALALDPRHPDAAALAADASRRADAERARARYERAVAAEAIGDHGAALAALREAVEILPDEPLYATEAARVALRIGSPDAARQLAEQAVRAAPRDARPLAVLGAVLHAQGEAKEARRVLRRALDLDPSLAEAEALLKRLRWSLK